MLMLVRVLSDTRLLGLITVLLLLMTVLVCLLPPATSPALFASMATRMGPDMSDVLEVNVLTGERIERDFTPAELEQRATDAAAAEAVRVEAEAVAAEKAAARAALLERLGITEVEAALLREAGI